jgi:hypothetical protein
MVRGTNRPDPLKRVRPSENRPSLRGSRYGWLGRSDTVGSTGVWIVTVTVRQ